MRNLTALFFMTFIGLVSIGQSNDTWISFWNKDSTLTGYKDQKGVIKIQPRFKSCANKFDNVLAVSEENNGVWHSYYLNKNGLVFGNDSLLMIDNVEDCESEGFIRFHVTKSDRVGMFDRNGNVAIPADYSELSKVMNGMVVALKGAIKKYWGEHYTWKSGKLLLIDTNNRILIDDFNNKDFFNFYSCNISTVPSKDTLRKNFRSIDGRYYSFIDSDKEFRTWLNTSFLNNLSEENLIKNSFKYITFWNDSTGWVSNSKTTFLKRNFELIKSKLLQLKSGSCSFDIIDADLNPYIYESSEYDKYFDNCRESKDWMYPLFQIVINYKVNNDLLQDTFEFLRTDEGYKLISVAVKNNDLR